MVIAHIDQKDVIWLSVDPLVDKYIDASPYVYCDGNPIKFLDPDGMDIFRYNKETGDITLYKKTDDSYDQFGKFKYNRRYLLGR